MSINFYTLIYSSFNFLKNKFFDIFILSFVFASINFFLYNFVFRIDEKIIIEILEKKNQLNSFLLIIQQLSQEEKIVFFHSLIRSVFVFFVEVILLVSSILTFLLEVSKKNNISAIHSIFRSFRFFPKMFFLLIICNLLIYFGFIFFVFPGFICMIGFCLSPIILISTNNITLLESIKKSFYLVFLYFWLIFPVLLTWFFLEFFISYFLSRFYFFPGYLVNIFSFTLNNLLFFFVLIYFFRFYMLVRKIKY